MGRAEVLALVPSHHNHAVGEKIGIRLDIDHVVAFRLNSTEPGTTRYNAFDFRYQDGARDAKAFLISGKGRIYVVTTGDNPGIYRAPATPSRQSMNTLVRVTDAPEAKGPLHTIRSPMRRTLPTEAVGSTTISARR